MRASWSECPCVYYTVPSSQYLFIKFLTIPFLPSRHQFHPEKGQAFETSAVEAVVNELYVGSPNCVFFGIFEGHGPNANQVVYFVSERLPAEISTKAADGALSFQECFNQSFRDVEKELFASHIDVKSSGCTCCCVVMEVSTHEKGAIQPSFGSGNHVSHGTHAFCLLLDQNSCFLLSQRVTTFA